MDDRTFLCSLLKRARRRFILNLGIDQSALALTLGMGGAILLLLAGTQILDWYWVVLLAAVSLGVGLFRLRKTIPSQYQVAQGIDHRLNLEDALSTATYFASAPPDARGDTSIRERQAQEADGIARGIDARVAMPFSRSRWAIPAVALAAVAFGLFALRYAVTGSLNLKPSLAKIAFDTFFPPSQQVAKANKRRDPLKAPPMQQGDQDSSTVQNDQTPEQPLENTEAPDAKSPDATDQSKEAAQKGKQDDPADQQQEGENADKGDKQPNGNDADQQGPQNSSPKDGKQNGKESKNGTQSENSSLLDKLKDAMSSMMNKMKSASKDGQQSPQTAQNQKGQQDKSNQGKQGQPQNQQSNSDAQSDQQSDSGEKQSADAKGSDKSSDKNASQDSKSGIGSADGDKAAREAEQLQAMGKISEIIGKRAQNVTGEVMVEVGSSKQQLKTPWAQKQATHVEAGSEIHRDEVPLGDQQFVQKYFEEIHKAAPAQKAATSKSSQQ